MKTVFYKVAGDPNALAPGLHFQCVKDGQDLCRWRQSGATLYIEGAKNLILEPGAEMVVMTDAPK